MAAKIRRKVNARPNVVGSGPLHDLDEMNVPGNDEPEFSAQSVAVYLDVETGTGGLRPESFDKLAPSQLEPLYELQRSVAMRRQLAKHIDNVVQDARELGVSWAQIGWCVGTSAQAARKRWGDLDD